jgi:L-rhamnose mutarotase
MKITSSQGNYKVIQTIKNRDELLVLGSWTNLVKQFGSERTFLLDQENSVFGIYICKQECSNFMSKLIQDIVCQEWEDLKLDFAETIPENLR